MEFSELNGLPNLKLNLGSGRCPGEYGFINIDAHAGSSDGSAGADIIANLLLPFPIDTNTVNEIYHSHLLEHFWYEEIIFFLKECYRVLKPTGLMSVCVPDASIYIKFAAVQYNYKVYQSEIDAFIKKFCTYEPAFHYHSPIDIINYMAYMRSYHRYMFDSENLPLILEEIGFKNVKARQPNHPLDLDAHKHESIYFQGEK